MSKYLTRAEIKESQVLLTEEVEIPEWGEDGIVLVREMTALEVTDFAAKALSGGSGSVNVIDGKIDRASLDIADLMESFPEIVAAVTVNERLEPILTVDDVNSLGGRSLAPIQRIVMKAFELSDLADQSDVASILSDSGEPAKNG